MTGMVSGWPLAMLLLLQAAWLLMLVKVALRQLDKRKAGSVGIRQNFTLAALTLAGLAIIALLTLHLTWLSPGVSQALGVRTIQALSVVLFAGSILAFALSLAGIGKVRWIAFGTSVVTGFWWFALAMSAAISMGAPIVRHPTRYLIPQGFVGWVEIMHGADGAPLPISNGAYVCRIPAGGVLRTSSKIELGWAQDQYFYYSEDGRMEPLRNTGWGGGGMIWGDQLEWEQQQDAKEARAYTERFYVGTEQQYKNAGQQGNRR